MTRTKTKTKTNNIVIALEDLLLDQLAIQDAISDMANDLLYYDLNSYDFYL